jgi:phytoene dehydrogenase-like protein
MDHYLCAGGFYPEGGGQILAASLVASLRANGGELVTLARVRKILVKEGRACGLRLDDGLQLDAEVIVSNADVKRTLLELVGAEQVSAATQQRIAAARMSLPLFGVYLGLDIDLRSRLPNTNYWYLPSDDLEGQYQACYRGELPERPFAYVTIASNKVPASPHVAPAGQTNLQVMTIVPGDYAVWGLSHGPSHGEQYRRNERYLALKQRLTAQLIEALHELLPETREHVVYSEAATPATQERYTLSTGGTSYGLEGAVDQIGALRPTVATEIPGLYLVGASTTLGHGIARVLQGGMLAAGHILGRRLDREVAGGVVLGRVPEADAWAADPIAASRGRRGRRRGTAWPVARG